MMIAPIAAAVAALEPEMAAKKPHATTATMASPPETCPSITLQKLMSRREIPPELIRLPASTKNRIAIRVNPDEPEKNTLRHDGEIHLAAQRDCQQRRTAQGKRNGQAQKQQHKKAYKQNRDHSLSPHPFTQFSHSTNTESSVIRPNPAGMAA